MLSLIEKALELKRTQLFNKLSAEELRLVAGACEELSLRKNEILLKEGESTETLYLIVTGSVKILVNLGTKEEKELTILSKGDCIGEMSLFDEEPHSATAIAIDETQLLIVRKERLYEIIDLYPKIAMEVIKVISKKLRLVNEILVSKQSM